MTTEIESKISNTKGTFRKCVDWRETSFSNNRIQDRLRRGEGESSDDNLSKVLMTI